MALSEYIKIEQMQCEQQRTKPYIFSLFSSNYRNLHCDRFKKYRKKKFSLKID